jgi:hypothetical protein
VTWPPLNPPQQVDNLGITRVQVLDTELGPSTRSRDIHEDVILYLSRNILDWKIPP